MKLIVKYFFLADILFFWGYVLDLDKNIFPWQRCFIWGGHLGFSHLEFGKIW